METTLKIYSNPFSRDVQSYVQLSMFGEWAGPDWNSQPPGIGDQNPLPLPIGMLMDFALVYAARPATESWRSKKGDENGVASFDDAEPGSVDQLVWGRGGGSSSGSRAAPHALSPFALCFVLFLSLCFARATGFLYALAPSYNMRRRAVSAPPGDAENNAALRKNNTVCKPWTAHVSNRP